MSRLLISVSSLLLLALVVSARSHHHQHRSSDGDAGKYRIPLRKNPTLRERLTDSGSFDIYMKHRNEALRTRYLELASQDSGERVGDEIDELLKNYMDVSLPCYYFCLNLTCDVFDFRHSTTEKSQ